MSKTIPIVEILERANFMLALDTLNQDTKSGIALMVEMILHKTENYSGYSYNNMTENHEVVEGTDFSRYYTVGHKIRKGN